MKNFVLILLFVLSTMCSCASFNYYRVTGGASITLQPQDIANDDVYYVYSSGSVTLSSDYNLVSASTPPVGRHWRVLYNVTSTTPGVYAFNFFGTLVNYADAGFQGWVDFTVITDHTGSPQIKSVRGPSYINQGVPVTPTILGASITDASVQLSKLSPLGAGNIIVGDISNVPGEVTMVGDASIDDGGSVTIASGAITSGKILDGTIVNADINASAAIDRTKLANGSPSQVLINDGSGVMTSEATLNPSRGGLGTNASGSTGFITFNAGSATVGQISEVVPISVSFESGEACNNRFKMPYAGTVTGFYAVCTKAIAGTDNGTIILKNAAGTTMGAGTITFTASDPLETAYSVSPSSNNTFSAGDILYAVTSKATAGGKALVSITVTRTN